MDDNPINFDAYRILAMYADGVAVADIGDEFGVTVQKIYEQMKEYPKEHAEAKAKLAAMRNSKYRRIGALASDIQMGYLEEVIEKKLMVSTKEMANIVKIGETAEKRADLNEGKATEITKEIGTRFVVQMPDGFEGKNITE